jgi:large subunit ribosomal protein L9
MARNVELLLTESVENLGIVGDVVKVRLGYARNFLLPRQLATEPSEELIKSLQAKRIEAERQLAEQRNQRAATIEKLAGYELHIERSCNDQGILYAGVTQQEIASALNAAGFANVRPRDVRLNEAIKRVDTYTVHIKFETDLATDIKLWVLADRKLDTEEREEIEIDDEGEVVDKSKAGKGDRPDRPERTRPKAPPIDLLEKPKTGWAPREAATPAGEAAPAAEAPADGGEKPKKAGKKAKN